MRVCVCVLCVRENNVAGLKRGGGVGVVSFVILTQACNI